MTTLRWEPYRLPAAEVGGENPLPVFRGAADGYTMNLDPAMPEDERPYFGWNTAWRALPHRMQDSYTREKREQDLPSLVLENDLLRATVLPAVGGRLVSLFDKTSGRELLHRNPVFQPANLALRNAWFSGGIEWNSGGPPGHHYATCSPVFAAEIAGAEGEPALRLYEWDRVKGYFWQIDLHLPPPSPLLYAHIRLINPHDVEIPMYWWTNIAVDEREDVRVLVPAETTFCHAYRGMLEIVDLPHVLGRDLTYSTRSPQAFDFFSRLPDGRRRWIAALGGDGTGFFEASTDRLRGRKLFCWGMSPGGRHWQQFLAAPGNAYIEIQAGLARTQMECIPMPARTEWTWTEAFGRLEADPARVHGDDWGAAWRAAAEQVDRVLPAESLSQQDARFAALRDQAPAHILAPGSGWGALEQRRRRAAGEPDETPTALPFPTDTLRDDQAPWISLLDTGVLPPREPEQEPGALMTDPVWAALLGRSVTCEGGDHWLAWWHLGNARLEARDLGGARQAWETSMARTPTGWALRNLAVLAEREGDPTAALDLMRRAWETGPQVAPLAVEYAQRLLGAGRHHDALTFIDGLPAGIRSHERLLLAKGRAALETGILEGVEPIFEHDFATIREGEVSLTDLWFALQERRLADAEGLAIDATLKRRVRRECPPPSRIDFRMAGEKEE